MQSIIRSLDGLNAGWVLDAEKATDWQWGRIVTGHRGEVERIAYIRDCTQKEKDALNNLLWTSQIVMRYKGVRDGSPWAFARID